MSVSVVTASRTKIVFSTLVLTLMLFLGSARPADAQGFVSPFIGYNFGGDAGCPEITDCEDKNLNWGVGVGSLGAILGAELEFAFIPDFFGDTPGVDNSVFTLMGNVMLAPRFGPVQPYGTAGLGLIKSKIELNVGSLIENSNNDFGWNTGGGIFIFFGDHVGIRGDIRYFHAFQALEVLGIDIGDTKLDYGRVSGALALKF
jgi:opacity protein-like surface antigen